MIGLRENGFPGPAVALDGTAEGVFIGLCWNQFSKGPKIPKARCGSTLGQGGMCPQILKIKIRETEIDSK